jgi:hypothetical protein
MTVQEQQDARAVVARPVETARTDILVIAIVGDVKPAHASQDVGQGPVAVA